MVFWRLRCFIIGELSRSVEGGDGLSDEVIDRPVYFQAVKGASPVKSVFDLAPHCLSVISDGMV